MVPGPAHPYTESDDRALVAAVGAGDGVALEEIYARYGRPCYSLARRILADEQLAHDAVQEVFLTLWRDASRYDPARGAFSSWLMSMTHHKAVDAVRREENFRKRRAGIEALDQVHSDAPTVEEQVWTSLRGDRLRAALRELPAMQREALTLAYFGGYTQREIAGITGNPLGTVKTRMLTGLRKLRTGLDGMSAAGESRGLDPGAPGARAPSEGGR